MYSKTKKEKTKVLVQNFETGNVARAEGPKSSGELVTSRPGGTKNLVNKFQQSGETASSQLNGLSVGVGQESSQSMARGGPLSPKAKSPRRVLLVTTVQEKNSMEATLFEATLQSLKDRGYEVMVSDLYEMNFNPVISRADIEGELKNKEVFDYNAEMEAAYKKGIVAKDIVAEHRKLEKADLVIFQFLMTMFSFPSILKGWFDRVLTPGHSYDFASGKLFDAANFRGKRAILSMMSRATELSFTNRGIYGDINVYLWPLHSVLRFVGFDVLPPNIIFTPPPQDPFAAWKTRLNGDLFVEKPLFFIPLQHFDAAKGFVMKEDIAEKYKAGSKIAPTIGQNLGLPYDSGAMTGKPESTSAIENGSKSPEQIANHK